MLQYTTSLRKSTLWPPNSSDEHVSCTAPLTGSSAHVPRLPSFLKLLHNPHALLTFDKVHNPLRLPRETTSERPKVLRTPSIFCTFDFDMLLRATTAYTFWTSQLPTGSEAAVFCTFGLGNVLRATTECTFSTSQLQKSSEADVLCTFWIGNVLCATTACNFSSLIWPHGPAPAALASLLFDPPEPQIIGKTQRFATFLPFRAPGPSFFWGFLFFDLLSSSLLFSSFLFSSLLWLFPSLRRWTCQATCQTYIYIIYIRYPIFCR